MVLLVMFVSTILSFGFGVFGYFLSAKASLRCTCNLRNNVYEKILTYSFQEFNVVTPPSLITRLTNDAQKIQQSLQMTFSLLIQAPITLIGTSVLIFTATNNLTTNICFGCLSLGFMSMIILMVGLIARIMIPLLKQLNSVLIIRKRFMIQFGSYITPKGKKFRKLWIRLE